MVYALILLADGIQAVAKPDSLTKIEGYFSLRADDVNPANILQAKYDRFLTDIAEDPDNGWVNTATACGIDLTLIAQESEDQILDMAKMLEVLTAAAKDGAQGPYPIHFKLRPLMHDFHKPDEVVADWTVENAELVITLGVVADPRVAA